jgi:hypothetical protein
MKVISKKETAILTATEKAILEKAFEIFNNIAEDCENYEGLWTLADNARDSIEAFIDSEDLYEVEPPAEGVAEVIVKITL